MTSFLRKGVRDVCHVPTAVKSQTQERSWIPQAHEHQEWSEGFGPSTGKRSRSTDHITSRPAVFMPGLPARRPHFLRNSADIERVKKCGRRLSTPLFNLVSSASGFQETRVGVIVGKRFGGAVVRNRAKRIFRELARQTGNEFVVGYDVLIFPRREALAVRHSRLRDAWVTALKQEGLLMSHSDLRCNESA